MRRLAQWFPRLLPKLIPALVLFGCATLGAGTAQAVCTITFDGGASTNSWHDAANWDTNVLPISTDTVCIGAAFAVIYSTGSTTIAALEHTSTQPFTLSGGTLTLTGASTIGSGGLALSGGTLTGTGTLDIAGLLAWSSGTHSGSATTNANGGLTLSGSASKTLTARTLNSPGAVTYSGTGNLTIGNGAVFNNNGTFDLQTDADLPAGGGAASTFNNPGTFTKSAGAATSSIGVAFNNVGTVNASSGILSLTAGGSCGSTCNGDYNAVAPGTLLFNGGTFGLGPGATVAGAGTVSFGLGTMNHAGVYNVTGATTVDGGAANFTGTVLSVGTLSLLTGSGSANFSSGETITPVGTVTQTGSTLTGSDTLTIAGLYDWSGGTHSGSGTTNANGGMTLGGLSSKSLNARTLNAAGMITYTGTGGVNMANGAVFNNNGSFDLQTDADFTCGGGATGIFNNNGTFTKSGAGGLTSVCPFFSNSGTVNASSGTLLLNGGGSCGGTCNGAFNVSATLDFSGGTFNLGASSSIAGAGTVLFSGGTVNHAGAYNITGNTTVTFGNPTFTGTVLSVGTLSVGDINSASGTIDFSSGETIAPVGTVTHVNGTITGSDTLDIAGMLLWSGSADQQGSGITNANGGMTLAGGNSKALLGRTFNNNGAAVVTGAGSLALGNGAVFNNNGSFDLQADANITNTLSALRTFNNAGTFTKSAGTQSDVNVEFNNSGTLNASSGLLRLRSGGSCGGACNGTFNASASLTFGTGGGGTTYNLGASSNVAGAGTVEFNAATVNLGGAYNVTGATVITNGCNANFTGTVLAVGTLTISGGTANFSSGEEIMPAITLAQGGDPGIAVDTFTFSSGTLTGSDTVTIAGTATWSGGTMTGTGATNFNGGLTLSSANAKNVMTRTLNNNAGATMSGTGSLGMGGGALFNNNGTFDLQSDAAIGLVGGGPRTYNNSGTFTKSAGAGSTIAPDFNNSGTVSVAGGSTLSFTGTFGQSGGSTRTCFTTAPPGGLNLLGGSFFGVPPGPCTITGNINNTGGTMAVGDGMGLPVIITLNSTYTQGAGANFTMFIGGTTPGGTANNFGQLNVGSGMAVLGGTLNVVLINGFVPQPGNSFNPLNYGSRAGIFSNINFPDISPNSWHVSQGPTAVVLSVVSGTDPVINSGGSVNAASFTPGAAVAPGGIAAVFGSHLATSLAIAGAIPLPTTLGGATMLFNGSQSVPKFFAADSQINIQIPWELQGATSANLTDTVNAVTSPVEPVSLAMFAPGLFAVNQAGTGQGAILIANTATFAAPAGSIPGAQSRAAERGVDFLEIYCTGLGAVTNQPATGNAAGSNPLSATTSNASVTIGGVPATVLFSGLAPGFVGLYVVTLQVPAGSPVGNSVPVVLTIGGVQSNAVTIAVE